MSTSVVPCPICGQSTRFWRDKDNYSIWRCTQCGYGFVYPRPDPKVLNECYSQRGHGEHTEADVHTVLAAEKKYPNSTIDAKRMIGELKALVKHPRNLLDIGCGYGFFSLEARKQGFSVTALEVASVEREIAQQIAKVVPLPVTFEDFDAYISFDAILMSQVLEHALDPMGWLRKAHGCLARRGAIAIAVPNFDSLFRRLLQDRDPYVIPPFHLNYFSPGTLELALEKSGFEVKKIYTVSRLPRDLPTRKLSAKLSPLQEPLGYLQDMLTVTMDRLSIGMFVNAFAVKRDSAVCV